MPWKIFLKKGKTVVYNPRKSAAFRRRMSIAARKKWAERKQQQSTNTGEIPNAKNHFQSFDPASYIYGRVQHFIEVYASGNSLSQTDLTRRVAALLHSSTGGEILGTEHNLSQLRRETPKTFEREQSVEMVGSTHQPITQREELRPVRKFIRRRRRMPFPRKCRICRTPLSSPNALHDHYIVHHPEELKKKKR